MHEKLTKTALSLHLNILIHKKKKTTPLRGVFNERGAVSCVRDLRHLLRIQDLLSAVNVYALKESVREGSHNGF